MSELPNSAAGVDATLDNVLAAGRKAQDEALRAWSRGCTLYAHYFEALSKADGVDGLVAANAKFANEGLEVALQTASAVRPLDGGASAP